MSLTEEDVPGAKFVFQRVEDHSMQQLRRWLECRGLKKTGLKKELVERCIHCINAGRGQEIDVSVDGGHWYDKRFNREKEITDIPSGSVPGGAFRDFPSVNIPEYFNRGHIYFYFVESALAPASSDSDEGDTATTEKPFRRGKQYCESGYVTKLMDCESEDVYFLKGVVKSSFRQNNYSVQCMLSKKSSHILSANCKCKQSALGRCSHVMAVLLMLLEHVQSNGYGAISCTSRPRMWGLGCKNKNPDKVSLLDYSSTSRRSKRAMFDPRPSLVDHESKEDKVNRFLRTLEARNNGPSLWQTLLQYKYEDFILDDSEMEVIKKQRDGLIRNAMNQGVEICSVIGGTEGQSGTESWFRWRSILITASNAKRVYSLKSLEAEKTFIRQHVWGFDPPHSKEMNYGRHFEGRAREEYRLLYLFSVHGTDEVKTTGLWINRNFPGLGCSPDGFIWTRRGKGLLKIKCPFLLKDCHPEMFDTTLAADQLKTFFMVRNEVGELRIRANHSYFYQVQVSMMITRTVFCHLLVWSSEGFCVIEIDYDDIFATNVSQKLIAFQKNVVAPEYFLQKCPRNLPPAHVC